MTFFYKKMKRIIKERTVLTMMIDYTLFIQLIFFFDTANIINILYIIVIIKFLINVYLFIITKWKRDYQKN